MQMSLIPVKGQSGAGLDMTGHHKYFSALLKLACPKRPASVDTYSLRMAGAVLCTTYILAK